MQPIIDLNIESYKKRMRDPSWKEIKLSIYKKHGEKTIKEIESQYDTKKKLSQQSQSCLELILLHLK